MAAKVRRPITIKDVAAHAGVSFKSVSNVVNDRPYVSDELRRRVQHAIKELGYRPHSVARSLINRRSNLLGVVLRASAADTHADPFFSQFLLGACTAAGAEGFGVLVQILLTEEPFRFYADVFDHQQIDGLIDFSPRFDDASGAEEESDQDLPVVRIGRARPGTDTLAVDGDNEQGAYTAVSHLISLGHRRIGMIANADLSYTVANTRVQGYRQALAAHGLPFEEDLLIAGSFSRQSGQDAMVHLLDLPKPPNAVFVSSDRMALGAMRAVYDRGLRIPQDMAIVGYDDLFLAEHTNPPLTTVQTPIDEISTRSTRMLIDAIRGLHIEPRQVILPTRLVVRQSCGATTGATQDWQP
jgi:DNA-binding LacI/PurR family transcriptional regulator